MVTTSRFPTIPIRDGATRRDRRFRAGGRCPRQNKAKGRRVGVRRLDATTELTCQIGGGRPDRHHSGAADRRKTVGARTGARRDRPKPTRARGDRATSLQISGCGGRSRIWTGAPSGARPDRVGRSGREVGGRGDSGGAAIGARRSEAKRSGSTRRNLFAIRALRREAEDRRRRTERRHGPFRRADRAGWSSGLGRWRRRRTSGARCATERSLTGRVGTAERNFGKRFTTIDPGTRSAHRAAPGPVRRRTGRGDRLGELTSGGGRR